MTFKIKDSEMYPLSMFDSTLLEMYKNNPSKWWTLMEVKTKKR